MVTPSLMRHLFIVFFLAASTNASAQDLAHIFPHHYTLHAMHADIIPLSAGEKAALADDIIEGEVVATQSFWKNNRIVSTLTIASETTPYQVELMRDVPQHRRQGHLLLEWQPH